MSSESAPVVTETERVAALYRLALLDTPAEPVFDQLTRLAARLLRTPVALISLVDTDRVFIKSAFGLPSTWPKTRSLSLSQILCPIVVATGAPVSIADISTSPGLSPTVKTTLQELGINSYLGVPLKTATGAVLGAFCLIDHVPRAWTDELLDHLQEFAQQAFLQIDLRSQRSDLQARNELYHILFAHAPLGQSLGTHEGYILTANPALCDMLGYSEEELKQLHFPTLTHPDDRQLTYEYMQRMARGERPSFDFEKRYIRKDGSTVWVRSYVALVRDEQGKPKYGIGLIQDITERKRLEAQLLQAQKLESIGRLAGGVAHDFNNLLTVILGNVALALAELPPDHAIRPDLTEINHSAQRAAGLTQQLLAFARQQIMEVRVVDLNDLIFKMDGLLRRLIGSDVELVLLPSINPPLVKVDPGQIEQVFVNLVVNARDAMPEGGKITIEVDIVVLDEAYAEQHLDSVPGTYVMLAVTDTGVGISPEIMPHIFEPFFTTKEQGKGTGLGLATCFGIVKQHGGTIWVYSEPEQGTTIKMYFPCVEDILHQAAQTVITDEMLQGTETILLVEDETALRLLASRILRQHGYTVIEAANGEEALQHLTSPSSQQVQLVITDMVMPQMGGRHLMANLKGAYPEIKLLLMSGYTESSTMLGALAHEDVAFLQKPFTPSVLLRKVRTTLDAC